MADLIQIDAAGVEAAYVAAPAGVNLIAAGLEVAYKVTDPPTDVMIIAGGLEVAYLLTDPPPPPATDWVRIEAAGLEVAYSIQVRRRKFPVCLAQRRLQSQTNCRKFPVIG